MKSRNKQLSWNRSLKTIKKLFKKTLNGTPIAGKKG